MNAEILAQIYAYTAVGVGVILAAAGLGSAIGWGLICAKTLEGIARQPEMRPAASETDEASGDEGDRPQRRSPHGSIGPQLAKA